MITYRNEKGSPLTIEEMDGNFRELADRPVYFKPTLEYEEINLRSKFIHVNDIVKDFSQANRPSLYKVLMNLVGYGNNFKTGMYNFSFLVNSPVEQTVLIYHGDFLGAGNKAISHLKKGLNVITFRGRLHNVNTNHSSWDFHLYLEFFSLTTTGIVPLSVGNIGELEFNLLYSDSICFIEQTQAMTKHIYPVLDDENGSENGSSGNEGIGLSLIQ